MKAVFSLRYSRAALGTALVALTFLLGGCSGGGDDVLKVGVMAGPEADVMKIAIEKLKADNGIEAKIVEFSDYVSPNIALSDGSINVNAFQHRPYLDSMVEDRGFKLVAVGNTFVYPIGAYSRELKNIESLKDGAIVAIPNDPSNEGRTLILLDQKGLIKLKDIKSLEATPADIIENPKKLQFIELDAAQLPRALDDVDIAFINSTYAVPAGLLPARDALISEGKDSPYVNILVAREADKDDSRVLALVKSYQTEEVEKNAAELFKGSAVAGWK